jgi:predicted PhzF superfamily epimerase YddE/YHI9
MREPGGEGDEVVEFEIVQGVEMGRRSDISVQVRLGPVPERMEEKRVEEIWLGGSSVQVMEGLLRL